jgi:beta-galactosidase
MRELAWVHRPVAVSVTGKGARAALQVHNKQSFTGLGHLRAEWELLVDGARVEKGRLNVPATAPGRVSRVPLPCTVPDGSGEVHLTVRFFMKKETDWAPAGHLVAWDQVCLREARTNGAQSLRGLSPAPVKVEPSVTLWRAATDNDGFKLMPHLWAGFGRSLERWLSIDLPTRDASLVRHRTERTVLPGGAEHITHTVTVPPKLEDLPRIGASFAVPSRFTRVRWFGRGPHECYPDRKSSAVLGIWEADPDELPYLVPQEFGARADCRWFEVFDPSTGEAVRVTSTGAPLSCSAVWHTDADLFEAADHTELTRRRFLTVHVDAAQRGLGTASCGPDTLPQYRIPAGTHTWSYAVSGPAKH